MSNLSRRQFIRNSSLIAATLPALKAKTGNALTENEDLLTIPGSGPTRLRWLDGGTPKVHGGTAFGVPWPMGKHAEEAEFTLLTPGGKAVPMQTWTTATWPDGSLKWTGHALAPDAPRAEYYEIIPGKPAAHPSPVRIQPTGKALIVDTGIISCILPKEGASLISSVKRGDTEILNDGQLIGFRQDAPEPGSKREEFTSDIQSVVIEQSGPVRAVVKVDGMHRTTAGRAWLPFSVRLYFHAGSDAIRMTHTFVFDGDEHKDFISGLGVQFKVCMQDELYNRHIRFAGQSDGLWGESVQGLTGLRRDPGKEVRSAQIAGEKVPDIRTWPKELSTRMHWIPTWGDFSLSQVDANGFAIRKRTKPGCGWIKAAQGRRAEGLGYVGGASGGVVFGMRDFWKLHPTQLDIRNAATDLAKVTLWMWSPDSPAMDIRFYHDGLGQELTGPIPGVKIDGIEPSMPDLPYEKQVDALQVTYEDYEPGFGTPHGVARTTDILLMIVEKTPHRDELVEIAGAVSTPPQLVPRPEDMLRAKVFSNMWGLPNRSSKNLAAIEDRLN